MGGIDLTKFRPNLAATTDDYDWSKLQYPVLVSPKLDGIRCVTHPTMGPVSRSLKPIKNDEVRTYLANPMLRWLDGELTVGPYNAPDVFSQSQSGVMSVGGNPNWTYWVFDDFEAGHMCGFGIRLEDAMRVVGTHQIASDDYNHVRMLPHMRVDNYEELQVAEETALAEGFEGLMIRSLSGKYKFGRSTTREGGLLKMKRFEDDEAQITDWSPLELNTNDPVFDAMGLQKRGYSKEGKVIDDSRVGRFFCRGVEGSRWAGVGFWIGSGLDDDTRRALREAIRSGVDSPIGRKISYKYQAHGSKDAPRTPIWKGFRGDE